MPRKRIYLAGKVTGLSRYEAAMKFSERQKILEKEGYEVINPLNIAAWGDDWHTAMRKCIKSLMDCDEAYFMPCWVESKGAFFEREIAMRLNILCRFEGVERKNKS